MLVILPEDDPELYEENSRIVDATRLKEIPVVVVRIRTPRPQISKIEVVAA